MNDEVIDYAIEEAFAGDFKSLKERFPMLPTQLGEPSKLVELKDIREALLQEFRAEVIKRLL